MIKIADIMREPVILSDKVDLRETLEEFICKKTNSALIVDEAGKLVGEVSVLGIICAVIPDYIEDDAIAAHVATEAIFREDVLAAKNTPIVDIMKKNPKTIALNASLAEASVTAINGRQSRVPVVDDEHKPIGVLTRTEIKQVIGDILEIDGCFAK